MPSKKRKEVESSVRRNTRSKAAKAFAASGKTHPQSTCEIYNTFSPLRGCVNNIVNYLVTFNVNYIDIYIVNYIVNYIANYKILTSLNDIINQTTI